MKLAVFGGTGKTGQHVIQQALDAGHEVVTLARMPSKVTTRHPNLKLIQGDILNIDRVEETIQGVDAVISVLGPSTNKPDFTISQGMNYILKAMWKHSVRRIIMSAGAGIREPQDSPNLVDHFFGFLLSVLAKNVVADMQQAVAKVKASDLDWTVVRVPMLTEVPAQGNLKIGHVGDIGPRIGRADLATFMLDQVNDKTYVHRLPAISN
jgi:putative NADH-flavin reductase